MLGRHLDHYLHRTRLVLLTRKHKGKKLEEII